MPSEKENQLIEIAMMDKLLQDSILDSEAECRIVKAYNYHIAKLTAIRDEYIADTEHCGSYQSGVINGLNQAIDQLSGRYGLAGMGTTIKAKADATHDKHR